MSKDTKGKPISWLKGVILPNQTEQNSKAQVTANEVDVITEEAEPTNISNNNSVFSKDNLDKVSLDLIMAVENILADRQLSFYKRKDLEEQLQAEKEVTNRLKHDKMKKEQLLHEKAKEISDLENKLTSKQMSYDQLLEDYKNYQQTSNSEFEKMTAQLETEISKYNKLSEESTNIQYKNLLQIKELEERIRELEVENQQYIERYQKILDEKNQLMQTINDFTEKMSFSFAQEKTTASSQAE